MIDGKRRQPWRGSLAGSDRCVCVPPWFKHLPRYAVPQTRQREVYHSLFFLTAAKFTVTDATACLRGLFARARVRCREKLRCGWVQQRVASSIREFEIEGDVWKWVLRSIHVEAYCAHPTPPPPPPLSLSPFVFLSYSHTFNCSLLITLCWTQFRKRLSTLFTLLFSSPLPLSEEQPGLAGDWSGNMWNRATLLFILFVSLLLFCLFFGVCPTWQRLCLVNLL